MKLRVIVPIVLLLVIVIVVSMMLRSSKTAAPSSSVSASPSSASSNAANTTINIKSYAFSSATLTIKKGTTVTWTNYDTASHTVTTDDGAPTGGANSGGLISKGNSFSYTFNTVGTFPYHCEPHPYMKASITVTE